MLTPTFTLTQDDEFITLIINAPYTSVREAEFYIEENIVIFTSKPYYLRLHLPGQVLDDDSNEAKYDADKGTYTARIAKQTKGEEFEGLDMLTKLLTPPEAKWKSDLKPNLVEEVNDVSATSDQTDCCGDTGSGSVLAEKYEQIEEEDIDWFVDQCASLETESTIVVGGKYGFAQKKSGMSQKLMLEYSDIFDVRDPDNLTVSQKKEQKHTHEAEHFSDDHYLADLYDNTEIHDILDFQPWWVHLSEGCTLTPETKEQMLQLPKKSYLLDSEELNRVYLSLVDIIFAYAYNHRILYGENNVESGWTISKLASTLSWFDSFTSLQDVVVSCFRRALVFPLCRNWDLCVKVLEDVQTVFSGGKKPLLKCLLDVHASMIACEPRFVFNDLYITDYCVWIQSARTKHLQSLASALKSLVVSKQDVGLDLEELELAASLVLKEQEEGAVDELVEGVGHIDVGRSTEGLDSDDDSDDGKNDDKDEEESEEDSEDEEETDSDEETDSNEEEVDIKDNSSCRPLIEEIGEDNVER